MPRILVVDDDPMVGATIEVLLLRQGFDVTLTDGGSYRVFMDRATGGWFIDAICD